VEAHSKLTITGGLQGDITNNATVEFIDVMVSITCSSIISGTGVVIKSAFGETTIFGSKHLFGRNTGKWRNTQRNDNKFAGRYNK